MPTSPLQPDTKEHLQQMMQRNTAESLLSSLKYRMLHYVLHGWFVKTHIIVVTLPITPIQMILVRVKHCRSFI